MKREFVYLDDDVVTEAAMDTFCAECEGVEIEPDIHYASCPCDFYIGDASCPYHSIYEEICDIVDKANSKISEII